MQFVSTVSNFLHIMIRHNVDFCKNEPRFMPLIIFHLNCILLLMMKMNKKQFLFHSWKIRAEGRILLKPFLFFSCHSARRSGFWGITVQEQRPKCLLNDYERTCSKGEWDWKYTVMWIRKMRTRPSNARKLDKPDNTLWFCRDVEDHLLYIRYVKSKTLDEVIGHVFWGF